MAVKKEYPLESVAAVRVPSDEIDRTFRSTTIGELLRFS
jgi:hypothetical protein